MLACSKSTRFFFSCYADPRDLHSFPTRRSSDLGRSATSPACAWRHPPAPPPPARAVCPRSEEHTSELQSHSDLVCRLLLEKKKELTFKVGGPNCAHLVTTRFPYIASHMSIEGAT